MPPTITRIVEVQDIGDRGQLVPSVRIEFKIGPHGPFTVLLPRIGFTSALANQKIQEFASHITSIQGAS